MRSLITGAGGFVGPHLARHLAECGDEVVATDRRGERALDVCNREETHDALQRIKPEIVYHLAAFSHVGESFADPDAVIEVNVHGTANLLDAAGAAGVHRVLIIGSAEEYGRIDPADLPLTESAPLRPTSPYGKSKVAASQLAAETTANGGVATVRVRPFNHIGPGQSPRFVVAALAARIVAAEQADGIVPIGPLDPVRDFTDVRDVVRAYRLVAHNGEPGEVYNICTGVGVSVGEIAQKLLERADRKVELLTDSALVRPVDIPVLIGDSSRLRAATGWSPEYALDATLDDVMADARAHHNATNR